MTAEPDRPDAIAAGGGGGAHVAPGRRTLPQGEAGASASTSAGPPSTAPGKRARTGSHSSPAKRPQLSDTYDRADARELVDAAFRLAEAAADRVQGPIERVAADAAAREVRSHLEGAKAGIESIDVTPDVDQAEHALDAAERLSNHASVSDGPAESLLATVASVRAALKQRGLDHGGTPRPSFVRPGENPTDRKTVLREALHAGQHAVIALLNRGDRDVGAGAKIAGASLDYATRLLEAVDAPSRKEWRDEVEALSASITTLDERIRARTVGWHGAYVGFVIRPERGLRALVGVADLPRTEIEPPAPAPVGPPADPRFVEKPGKFGITAPKKLSFGAVEVGAKAHQETILWAHGGPEAQVASATIKHSDEFRMREAPTRIVSVHSPSAEQSGRLRVDFIPEEEGWRTGALILHVTAFDEEDGRIGQDIKILLAGEGHRAGTPTPSERAKQERANKEYDKREEEKQKAAKKRKERAEDDLALDDDKGREPYHPGRLHELNARFEDFKESIKLIDEKRIVGIEMAAAEAAGYKKVEPPATPTAIDFLKAAGSLALGAATAGLSQAIAGALLGDGGLTEMLKTGLENAIGAGLESKAEAAVGESVKAGDPNPWIGFFGSLKIGILDTTFKRIGELSQMKREALPALRNPEEFADAMKSVKASLTALGTLTGGKAALEQANSARAAWASFVSKRSGATTTIAAHRDPKGAPVEEQTVSRLEAGDARDGVFTIYFSADVGDPASPVKVVGGAITGISAGMVRQLAQGGLIKHNVPMRVLPRTLTDGGQPMNTSLAIARNEAGQVDVNASDREAYYLARKGGAARPHERRPSEVAAGARRLVEEASSQASSQEEAEALDATNDGGSR